MMKKIERDDVPAEVNMAIRALRRLMLEYTDWGLVRIEINNNYVGPHSTVKMIEVWVDK